MSQLGCVGSGNKLQKQKKGPWSLGKGEREKGMRLEGSRGGQRLGTPNPADHTVASGQVTSSNKPL